METSSTEGRRIGIHKEKGIPPKIAQLRQKLGHKAKTEPKFRFYSLYGLIYRRDILEAAWKAVERNGGSPGLDRISIKEIRESGVGKFLDKLERELKNRTYKPDPIRRVFIPKADRSLRALGIPTVKDRVVQMATLLVIEPIFEADFKECSYGFRPGRSAHQALEEIAGNFRQGKVAIYDADLKGYFDSIPHDKLMACVKMRITDSSVLKLIRMWLKAPIVEVKEDDDGKKEVKVTKPTKGTPQGGVISPVLSNLYLHWFDERFHRENGPHRFANASLVRYCDDFVVMARYQGDRMKEFIRSTLEDWMGLSINQEKTKVVELKEIGSSVDFLGYTFRVERSIVNSGTYLRVEPSKKSVKKAKEKIKELTDKSVSFLPVDKFIGRINRHLRGWKNYFQKGNPSRVFGKMDYYVESKVIKHLKRRSQRPYKKPEGRTWYQHLRKLGLNKISAK